MSNKDHTEIHDHIKSTFSRLKSGENPMICPECSHTRQSHNRKIKCLYVNRTGNDYSFYCHHCEAKGGADIKLADFELRDTQTQVSYSKPVQQIPVNINEPAIEWFYDRGITTPTLTANGVYTCTQWMPQTQSETGVIAFPAKRHGEVVNIKYRDRNKNFKQEKGCEKVFIGLHHLDKELEDTGSIQQIVIVEGEMDMLSMHEAGIMACISVPEGAPNAGSANTEKKFEYIGNCIEYLNAAKSVVLAVDSDANGQALLSELARRIGKEKCLLVDWPQGIKDANDYLVAHGSNALSEYITKNTRPYPISDLYTADSFASDLVNLYHNGHGELLSTGFSSIDQLFRIRKKELSVVTGMPGSGKSEFLDALSVNLAKKYGWKFAVCSFENTPEQHMAKLAHRYIGRRFFARNKDDRMSEDDLQRAITWINNHFFFIRPNDIAGETTVSWLLEKAKAAVKRHGIDGLIIDPYNDIERNYKMNEAEHVNQLLKKLKLLTHSAEIHTWLVAHPAKPQLSSLAEKKEFIPTLYDISGGANFRNRADIGFTVHRPRDDEGNRSEITQIHCTKVRHANVVGQEGSRDLKYNPETASYSVMEEEAGYF